MKYVFKRRVEWSNCSPHSPSHHGQLPKAAVLPTGERVGLDPSSIDWSRVSVSRAGYVAIHPRVRIQRADWGDDGCRPYGRAEATLTVLAPKGTRFMFAQYCPFCGEQTGEQELPGRSYDERADEIAHPACQACADEGSA